MDFLVESREISPWLGDFVEAVAWQDLSFSDPSPIRNGSYNKMLLWVSEYLAETNSRIDVAYRCRMYRYITDVWKQRLKAYHPYQQDGYVIYMYDQAAPALSVREMTDEWEPEHEPEIRLIDRLEEFFKPFAKTRWSENFIGDGFSRPDRLLEEISRAEGSIGKSVAQRLGLNMAELRHYIEWLGIQGEVNRIRKKHGRTPARFDTEYPREGAIVNRMYVVTLPPFYR